LWDNSYTGHLFSDISSIF